MSLLDVLILVEQFGMQQVILIDELIFKTDFVKIRKQKLCLQIFRCASLRLQDDLENFSDN